VQGKIPRQGETLATLPSSPSPIDYLLDVEVDFARLQSDFGI
jgi:hypothetical protein